jgi:hypothetical protein
MFLLVVVVVVVFMEEIHTICSYHHNHHHNYHHHHNHHHRNKKNSLVSTIPNMNKNNFMMILFNNMRSTIIQGDSLDNDRDDDESDDNDDDSISRRSSSRLQSYNFPIDTSIPGHIKQLPYTLNDKTRLQYASIVVSTAIVFMTLKVRYDTWIDKWNNNTRSKDMDNNYNYYDQSMMRDDNQINTNTDDDKIVKLSNTGIIYEDTIIIDKDDNDRTTTPTTSTTTNTKVLDYGRQYDLSIKVYYNGLLVNNYINITFIYGMKNTIFNKLSLSGLNEIGVFDGMKVNSKNKNNNYQGNSKRIVILPAKYAYGDQGLLPYVPAKAAVKVELSIM